MRASQLSDVEKLRKLILSAKSGYARTASRYDGPVAQRLMTSLLEADRTLAAAQQHLGASSAATLPRRLLADVFGATDQMREDCTALVVVPPRDTLPAGADKVLGAKQRKKPGKRAQRLEEQAAEAEEHERRFRPAYPGAEYDALADEDYSESSGGMAEMYERSDDARMLLRGFETQVLEVRRVAKVTRGGTNFRYRALVAIGNGKGVGGIGENKAQTVQRALERATRKARRNLLYVPLYANRTVPHKSRGKFEKCLVYVRPAMEGAGLRCSFAFRGVLEMIGLRDVSAKQHGARNRMNAVKALFDALGQMRDTRDVEAARGVAVTDLASFIERRLGENSPSGMATRLARSVE